MGNSKSSQTHGQIITVNHPNFGEVELIDHEGQKYMKIKMLVDSEKTIKKWEEEQKILKGIDTEPLLLSTDHQFEKQGMCGTTGVLHILYENHPVILKDEIQNRKETQQSFEQNEVWYLLHVLISSAAEFHKRQKKIGDIRPHNIFINEDGQIKLANYLSWPRQENNYFKSLDDKEQTYLAPEEMNELSQNVASPNVDPVKSESFSIGLTLLDAILLEDSSQLYNFKNSTFNISSLQALLIRLNTQKYYSPFLKEIINQLLQLEPQNRKSAEQIYQKILPYEYNIKNLIAFTPIRNTPEIAGTRSIVSAYQNLNHGIQGSIPAKFETFFSSPHTYSTSVYETRNIIPAPTSTNLPIHQLVTNNRVTLPSTGLPSQNYSPYSSNRPVSNMEIRNPNTEIRVDHLGTYQPAVIHRNIGVSKSKQQLLNEIDQQIERSKRLYQ